MKKLMIVSLSLLAAAAVTLAGAAVGNNAVKAEELPTESAETVAGNGNFGAGFGRRMGAGLGEGMNGLWEYDAEQDQYKLREGVTLPEGAQPYCDADGDGVLDEGFEPNANGARMGSRGQGMNGLWEYDAEQDQYKLRDGVTLPEDRQMLCDADGDGIRDENFQNPALRGDTDGDGSVDGLGQGPMQGRGNGRR